MRNMGLLVLLAALSLGSTAGCDPSGSELSVVNESGEDLVVRAETAFGTWSKAVPARTRGTLFNSFSGTNKDTSIVVVFDGSCGRIAEIPFKNGGQVHVRADGAITMEDFEWRGAANDLTMATLADQSCP
jgi:hypothetical protein